MSRGGGREHQPQLRVKMTALVVTDASAGGAGRKVVQFASAISSRDGASGR